MRMQPERAANRDPEHRRSDDGPAPAGRLLRRMSPGSFRVVGAAEPPGRCTCPQRARSERAMPPRMSRGRAEKMRCGRSGCAHSWTFHKIEGTLRCL